MKNFWSLIPRNIIKNKKRTLLMGVSIILAIALITTLSIVKESLIKNASEKSVEAAGGDYDLILMTQDYNKLKQTKDDEFFKKSTIVNVVGRSNIPETDYILDINAYDKDSKEVLNFKLIEGEYPKNKNEIALEQWIIDEMKNKTKIGDNIKLSYDMVYRTREGFKKKKLESEFKLTGILKFSNAMYTTSGTANAYVTTEYYDEKIAECKLNEYGLESRAYVTLNDKYSRNDVMLNLPLINSYKNVYFNENDKKVIYEENEIRVNLIFEILFVLIGAVASIVIYNIFNIIVTERTKEFGVLRAIGASANKIRILVILEGIFLGVIFIPIGIILGILCSKLFSSVNIIPKSGMKISSIIGFLSIIIGSYFPASKASKISPMEAIASSNNLNLKGYKLKAGLEVNNENFIRKKFSFEKNMAYLNIVRNKKRFITTIISLNIIIIMIFGANYLIGGLSPINDIKENFKNGEFKLTSFDNIMIGGIKKEEINKIQSIDGVKNVYTNKILEGRLKIPKDTIESKGYKYLRSRCKSDREVECVEKGDYYFNTTIIGYDNKELSKLINSSTIDIKEKSPEIEDEIILVKNSKGKSYTNVGVEDFIDVIIDKFDIIGTFIGNDSYNLKITGITSSEDVDTIGNNEDIMIIMSNEAMEKYLNVTRYSNINIQISDEDKYNDVKKAVKNNIKNSKEIELKDYKKEIEDTKTHSKEILMILYGFIGTIAVVSIINLINVMNMSVLLRKKDISMLRAIGIGNKKTVNMIVSEGLFYGLTAGVFGNLLGLLLVSILYLNAKSKGISNIYWSFPYETVFLTLGGSIIICVIASLLPLRKLFKESIVDSVRGIE